MMEEKQGNITITIRNITAEDAGTYWCGAESTDKGRSNPFFNRFVMSVVIQPTTATFPVSSTQSTTASAQSLGGAHVVIIVIVCVSVLLLLMLFGLILILIYKRHLKSRAAAQHIKDEYIYEEIQEHRQEPNSGTAMNTINVTANFPTNPSASLHYSTINFQNCPGNGQALFAGSSSSACEYSTVKNSQSPISSTVNQPSSEDPLYSTVNKPQEE
ncbi:uncharacterized protein LOC131968767 [Centropristis striata]|uniref:uncharacterized protein LOC131968767 n=1 Tax=Centropristis striata TaxID=184440 RepID=UPI0027E192DF|nr:uncharacterized protein LOC131968767 [Centropristis striata]